MSVSYELQPEKARLRELFRRFRAGLDAADYRRRSDAINARMQDLPEVRAAACVHVYWPRVELQEVDVRPLIHWLHAQKKQIVLPVIRTFGRTTEAGPRLNHVCCTAFDGLRANKWGIFEPSCGETVPVENLDLVIVPALGAGRDGFRIGHGFGFYDEFLAGLSLPRVAPVYHECLVETLPHEAHDVRLTVIVTEHEVVRPDGL
jgi:5-formyltetrahydrofolate cyclo-ligase